ncbi:MAG: TonB family protein [Pyrinomonadaceae bacterium]
MNKCLNHVFLFIVSFFVLGHFAVSQDRPQKGKSVPIGQTGQLADKIPKALSYPKPVYPNNVTDADLTGQVRLYVKVNKEGEISVLDSFGPNAPCSNLDDPKVKEIRKAVVIAMEKAVFEIPMANGQPTEKSLMIKFDLRPKAKPPADGAKEPVPGGVVNGKALRLPKPEYPIGARYTRAAGTVQVEVLIGEDGKITSASAVSGDQMLRDTAVRTACKALFSPTLLAGQPVKVSGIITYNFIP